MPRMNQGGVEKGVLDLASWFKDRMVVISGGGRLVPALEKLGAVHYTLPVYRKSLLTLLLIPQVRRIIRQENISIVHARSRVPAWIGFFATRGMDVHFITTAHGMYSPHFFSRIMTWGKMVICPSKVIVRHLIDRFNVNEEKIRVISRWVDLDLFSFRSPRQRRSANTVLTVGRIAPSKGFEYLIEAFRKVVRSNPYLTLEIVGEAEKSRQKYLTYLKSLVHRYSLDYNVKFLGYRHDIASLLDQATMLVMPSVVEEAFGRVVIEAFAKGVPVIATKVGALEEIIEDGKDGLLVFPRNSEALAEAVLKLLQDHSLADSLAANARQKAEQSYSFAYCARQIEDAYRQACSTTRMLVIKLSSLGDIILGIPSLKALKEAYPSGTITLLTLKKYAGLFYDCPYVDKVMGLDDDYKSMPNILSLAGHLIQEGFDYIIDLQNNRASHLLSFLSFPRRSFGYDRKMGFLLSSREKISQQPLSPVDSQEKILRLLGVSIRDKKLCFWPMQPCALSSLGVDASLPLIGINVSASPKWQSKNWPVAHIRKLIEFIDRELPGYSVVLTGDRASLPVGRQLENSLKTSSLNLCGKTTVCDLVCVLRSLKAFITQDTAPLHMAQALGVPTIALFGPTDPARHSVQEPHLHVLWKKMPCSFCYKPKCENNLCMHKISPQEVFAKLKDILR